MFPNLRDLPFFILDTETTGLRYPVDRVFGFSIATPSASTFYWDFRRTPNAGLWLQDEVKGYKGKIVGHHSKFDWMMCRCSGITIPEDRLHCTMTTAVLIDEHSYEYSLEALCQQYLGVGKVELPSKEAMELLPFEVMANYAETDALRTLQLHMWQQKEIKRQGIEKIVEFEHRVLPSICRANARGVRVDLDQAERAMDDLTPVIIEKQKELNAIAGWDMNANSPPQVKKLLKPTKVNDVWQTEDGTVLESTPGGGPKLGAEALREINHPAAQLILEVRSLLKTRDTFLAKHILEHAVGDRVYPTINQNKGEDGGTGTGRLSYVDPALQQIPSRNKKAAAIVKTCFLPEEGHNWVDSDEASFEVRVFASLANVPSMIQAYKENPEMDGHQFTADITGLPRNASYSGQANAKQLNLSMIFNSGNGAIAQKMGMPWWWDSFIPKGSNQLITYRKAGPEAMAVINHYHANMPGVKELAEECKSMAEEVGYVETFTGRRLRFPHKRKAYKASGLKIQATAADINKTNWMLIEEALNGCGHLVLNTHDSYGMSIPSNVVVTQYARVKKHLESNSPLNVPVVLEIKEPGPNWWASTNGKRVL